MSQRRSVQSVIFGVALGLLVNLGGPHPAWPQNTVDPNASIRLDPDVRHFTSPIFDDVKQVHIHVHSAGAESAEHQAELPAPMRMENLEALLVKIYEHRFSSKDCMRVLESGPQLMSHKYGCDDQPVILFKDSEYRTRNAREARRQPGSLNIELQVFFDRSLQPPIAAVYLVQDRSDPQIRTEAEVTFPWIIPLNLSDTELRKRLFTYISNHIR